MSAQRIQFLRPSGASTWVVCYGYVAMSAAYPDIPDEADNDVREDGTAAHWLAFERWEGRDPQVDSLSPNSRVITEEMYDGTDLYLDELHKVTDAEWYIEREVDCRAIYPGMKGTPDAWCYRPGLLRVYDFKYGFRYVEVWENWQLLCYALSLVLLLNLSDDTVVEFKIIQPRSNHREGPVRTWRTTVGEIKQFLQVLRDAAVNAMGPKPLCTPNPGCVDCAGRHACEALTAATYTAMELSYSAVPLELDAAQVAAELSRVKEAAKRMEARITGLEGQAQHMLEHGQVVPGWGLEPTYARERYQEGKAEHIVGLGKLYKVNLAQPAKPISPAQARKLLPRGVIEQFTHKPSTGVKLKKIGKFDAAKKFSPQPE